MKALAVKGRYTERGVDQWLYTICTDALPTCHSLERLAPITIPKLSQRFEATRLENASSLAADNYDARHEKLPV